MGAEAIAPYFIECRNDSFIYSVSSFYNIMAGAKANQSTEQAL
jgi:hypothetical protein